MMTPAIRLTSLTHTFREPGLPPRQVLDVPALDIESGAQLWLRGKSGSGKTTLLNLIAGLLTPTGGDVEVFGQSLGRLREAERDRFRARHVGYVFQSHNLLPYSALENVEMPLAFLGEPPKARRARAEQALESVGLLDWKSNRPHQLSAGQRLRVAVARAVVTTPAVLLADEPTAALDPDMSEQIMDLLQSLSQANGITLLVASHDPALASRFERLLDLRDTRLYEQTAVVTEQSLS